MGTGSARDTPGCSAPHSAGSLLCGTSCCRTECADPFGTLLLCPLCFPEHRRRHPECPPGRTHVCLSSQRTVLGKATTGLPRHRKALTGRAAVRLLPQTAHRRRQTPRTKLWCSKPSQGLSLLPRVAMSRTWPGELLGLWLLQTESPTRSSVHRDGAGGETQRGREPAGASVARHGKRL